MQVAPQQLFRVKCEVQLALFALQQKILVWMVVISGMAARRAMLATSCSLALPEMQSAETWNSLANSLALVRLFSFSCNSTLVLLASLKSMPLFSTTKFSLLSLSPYSRANALRRRLRASSSSRFSLFRKPQPAVLGDFLRFGTLHVSVQLDRCAGHQIGDEVDSACHCGHLHSHFTGGAAACQNGSQQWIFQIHRSGPVFVSSSKQAASFSKLGHKALFSEQHLQISRWQPWKVLTLMNARLAISSRKRLTELMQRMGSNKVLAAGNVQRFGEVLA